MGFDKSRTIYFAMDRTTCSRFVGTCSKDIAIMDNIQHKLEAAGLKVKRITGRGLDRGNGPNCYYNMQYLYDNDIHDAILLHLYNGLDAACIKEIGTNGNDNRGRKVRANGNDVILAWFWDAWDCIHPGGKGYKYVPAQSDTRTTMSSPLQYMEANKIVGICVSSDNPNLAKGDYTGDLVAEEVIKLFDNTTSTTTTTETSTTTETNNNGKTLKEETIEKIYTKAYYSDIFTVKTDENGTFQLPVKLPYVGEYNVNYTFAGNKEYISSTRTNKIENYTGELFKPKLLMTRTTKNYGTGQEAEVTEVGSIAGQKHTTTETTVIKYETDGNKTTTTTKDSDSEIISPPSITPSTPSTDSSSPSSPSSPSVITVNGKDPYQEKIPLTADGKPQISSMVTNNKTYEMVDLNKSYTLTREQYTSVFYRDSKIMQLNDYKMTPYVSFECAEEPNKMMVLERERWNMVEESYHYYMVKGNGKKWSYSVVPYPEKLVIDFKNKASYFDGTKTNWKGEKGNIYYCGDNQNLGRTCGPTASSVTTQVVHNYYSERRFNEDYVHVIKGSAPDTLRDAFKYFGLTGTLFYKVNDAVAWLKQGKPVVYHTDDHYIALCDRSSDGDILVLNSTTSSGYAPYTGWRTEKTVRDAYAGAGVLVALNWNIKNDDKQKLNNYFQSMGGAWKKKENKKETVRYYQLH